MYPERLKDAEQRYFTDNEYFNGDLNYIHTYLHTDYKFKMHSHQFYEINIITEGSGKHYIENSVVDISVGDFFVIPPGIRHGYYSEDKINIYHILIKADFFSRYGEELENTDGFNLLFDIEPQLRQVSGIKFNISTGSRINSLFIEELSEMAIAEKCKKYGYLNALALTFICRLCDRIHNAASELCEADIIGVMEYIKSNPDSKLTLDGLAKIAHMSTSTLNRHFVNITGLSPMKYVLECRIKKAENLIVKKAMSKTDVAQACGFYDISHMNKHLKGK